MSVSSILLILFGYFFGSIPTSYIAGRLMRGIDLRQYGSGTVSGSGLYESHQAAAPRLSRECAGECNAERR